MPPRWSYTTLTRRAALAGIAVALPAIALAQSPLPATRSTMVPFDVSPFPFNGISPRTGKPFLDVSEGERRGRTARSGVLWEETTYSDRRVLLSIPRGFDLRKPSMIVVFFHGNGATLTRDVRNRQQVPRQIVESGLNAALVAPPTASTNASGW